MPNKAEQASTKANIDWLHDFKELFALISISCGIISLATQLTLFNPKMLHSDISIFHQERPQLYCLTAPGLTAGYLKE